MRNFEERMAEINRRSEQILARRKKQRSRFLAVCVPLSLCLLLSCGYFMRSGLGDKSTGAVNGSPELTQDGQNFNASLTQIVQKIQVSGPGITKTVTDKTQITEITALLTADYGELTMGGLGETSEELTDNNANQSLEQHTIVLHLQSGTKVTYTLSGSKLTDLAAEQVSYLSKPQLQALKELLGISR